MKIIIKFIPWRNYYRHSDRLVKNFIIGIKPVRKNRLIIVLYWSLGLITWLMGDLNMDQGRIQDFQIEGAQKIKT